jgi:division protein CdvB (Snf7/Vps24/ESCRT-III family)
MNSGSSIGKFARYVVTKLQFCEGAELYGQLEAAQAKARQQLKQLASKGDSRNAKILAREVVRSNKQKDRLHVSKAMLGSIHNQLAQQLGM